MHKTSPLLLLATAVAAISAPAQVSVSVIADTDLVAGILAGQQQMIPAGTNVTQGANLLVTQQGFTCTSSGQVDVVVNQGAGPRVDFRGSANIVGPAFGCFGANIGPHAIVAHFIAAQPTSGHLVISSRPLFAGFAEVDIGDDGTPDIVGSGSLSVPVVLGTRPLPVRAWESVTGAPGNVDISIQFVAGIGSVQTVGTPCGPELSGLSVNPPATGPWLELRAGSSAQSPYAYFVIGATLQSVSIAPLGCVLHTQVLLPIQTTVGPGGDATLRVALAPRLQGSFVAQYLVGTVGAGGSATFELSNALPITLP